MNASRPDAFTICALAGISAFGLFNIIGIRPDLIRAYSIYLILSWICFFVFSRIKLTILEQNYKLLYGGFIILLLLTYFFADPVRGSRRWIDIGFFSFQTSEFFKPFFLVTIAAVLSSVNKFTPRKFLICMGLGLLPVLMIFKQPDLGSALLYLIPMMSIVYFSGMSTKLVVRAASAGLALLPVIWLFLKDYQKARVIGFMNPDIDPQGLTYNLTQAIITIGSGGFFGKGLGLGTQARYRFLPEFHTDFAFASLIEQFGFVGGVILLSLFALLVFRLVRKIFSSKNNSLQYLYLIGVTTMLMCEVTVNAGMNMGLLPVTGIALPFISYGGASMISTMMMLGLASSVED